MCSILVAREQDVHEVVEELALRTSATWYGGLAAGRRDLGDARRLVSFSSRARDQQHRRSGLREARRRTRVPSPDDAPVTSATFP